MAGKHPEHPHPSVNNLTARVFVRAAGLDFEEVDVWGRTTRRSSSPRTPRTSPRCSRRRAAEGLALGELRDHAVPVQQARA